jgi:inositol transport system substrate-binding protein
MKKLLVAAAVSTALLSPLAAQAQKVGLAMAELDTFLTILKNGVVDAGKKVGATVQWKMRRLMWASNSARSRI